MVTGSPPTENRGIFNVPERVPLVAGRSITRKYQISPFLSWHPEQRYKDLSESDSQDSGFLELARLFQWVVKAKTH